MSNETCTWRETGEMWESACKYCFAFIGGTPSQNGFDYCPKCGRRLIEADDEEGGEG